MKVSKLSTTLFTVSIVAMVILVFDITSYLRGKSGYLIGKSRSHLVGSSESKSELDKKLNEISNSIISLSTRLSRIEESISKMDKSFEKKVIYPLRNETAHPGLKQSYDDEAVPDFSHYKEPSGRLHADGDASGTNESLDSNDSLFDHVHHRRGSKRWYKNDENAHGASTPKGSLGGAFKEARNSVWHRKSRRPHVFGHNYRLSSDRPSESPGRKSTFAGRDYFPYGMSYESPAHSLKYSNPPTFPRRTLLKKVGIAVEPKKEVSELSKAPYFNEIVNLDDLFSGIGKDSDSVVEVKRFDDLDSFRKFTKSQSENAANEENDNAAETSFFKMSDIIGAPQPGKDKKASDLSIDDLVDLTKMADQSTPSANAGRHEASSRGSASTADNGYGSRSTPGSSNSSLGPRDAPGLSGSGYSPKDTASLSNASYGLKNAASLGASPSAKGTAKTLKDSYTPKDVADMLYAPRSSGSMFGGAKKAGDASSPSPRPASNAKANENSSGSSTASGSSAGSPEAVGTHNNISGDNAPSSNEKTIMSIFINTDPLKSEAKGLGTKSNENPIATKFCESFESPHEAFRSGRCVYRNVAAPSTDPLNFGLGDELSLNPEDFINTIHATIKNMEESIQPRTDNTATGRREWAEKKGSSASDVSVRSSKDTSSARVNSKEGGSASPLPADSKKLLNDEEIQKPTLLQPSV